MPLRAVCQRFDDLYYSSSPRFGEWNWTSNLRMNWKATHTCWQTLTVISKEVSARSRLVFDVFSGAVVNMERASGADRSLSHPTLSFTWLLSELVLLSVFIPSVMTSQRHHFILHYPASIRALWGSLCLAPSSNPCQPRSPAGCLSHNIVPQSVWPHHHWRLSPETFTWMRKSFSGVLLRIQCGEPSEGKTLQRPTKQTQYDQYQRSFPGPSKGIKTWFFHLQLSSPKVLFYNMYKYHTQIIWQNDLITHKRYDEVSSRIISRTLLESLLLQQCYWRF